MSEENDLEMRFDLNVLQHLGLKMYTSLPAVVSEYVANSWDAWAEEVEIHVPQERISEDYAITIKDDGKGMTKQEINDKFLVVGRNRREDEGTDIVEKDGEKRKVMGRKGIGKLAGFGIAGIIRIRTVKRGRYVEFELDYDEMEKEASETDDATTTYSPTILEEGETEEESGTEVILTSLDLEQRPSTKYMRQRISRRFGILGKEFDIKINGESVTGEERNLKDRCEFLWTYDTAIDEEGEHQIEGWIGTLKNPVPEDIKGGVAVMARGKVAQKPITFGVAEGGTGGQHALQYMVGEIKADFLDEEEDLIATHRSEVRWERPPADKLYEFLANEIKRICGQWPDKRREEKMDEVREKEPYERYIEPLDDSEKKLADSFLGKLAEKADYNDETLQEMASYVSTGVQQKSFGDLVREIEESNISNPERLAELFDRYEVLDAMNTLRIVKGRSRAIQKFEELVEDGGGAIVDMHGFVSDNPWLIDPRWDYLEEEIDVRDSIKKNFETEKEDRVGFISLGDNNTVRLVDIRRPEYRVDIEDLNEFKNYVDYLRSLGNMNPIKDREVEGYIVAKGHINDREVEAEIRRMKMDEMRIRSYEDIKEIARRSHSEFLKVFERKAERTGSDMLRSYVQESEGKTFGQAELASFSRD